MKFELAKQDTPVPTGWSMKSKFAYLAQVYLLSSIVGEKTFFNWRGPIYRRLLNCDDAPGPPPNETMVG